MAGSNTTTSTATVPDYLRKAAEEMLGRAKATSETGYVPYYGPDVAAMTPSQIAAMQGTNSAASAFGLQTVDPMAGMPAATDYNGMSAYSSGSGYDAAVAELKKRFPGQYAAIMAQFIDPVTGAAPASAAGPTQMGMPVQAPAGRSGSGSGVGSMDWAEAASRASAAKTNSSAQNDRDRQNMGETSGGYTSFADLFNGGGAGAKGNTFQGGLLSGMLNKAGVSPSKSPSKSTVARLFGR